MNETSDGALQVNVHGVHRWLPALSLLVSAVFFLGAHDEWRRGWVKLLAYLVPFTACLALITSLGDQRWRLSLRSGVIRGPGRWSLFPAEIPLAELDRERSAPRKNPGAVRLLWSTDGRVISFHPHAYRPAELATFLDALGLA